MYEYIKGYITFVSPYYIVVEVMGIGYQVAVANPFSYKVDEDKECHIYIQQVVREDSETLYGFNNLEEKQLFIKLNSVSGIGPKSALAIMAGDDHGALIQAVETEDATFLTKYPGVGKKTAQQMVLDLKGKLLEIGLPSEGYVTSEVDGTGQTELLTTGNVMLEEAIEALSALGYSDRELKRINKDLEKVEASSTDDYLRQGLKLLMKK
ncbi:Holliday junction branch migration protein RuvA [Vagococcus coleopterorum]|uniref:Holliday junction branch migration complex subunit RuvA n=1 Tax=Vagococcus coleopterorum TaxID=2714946 RepID=A0A6G8ALL6_9ENTE|nr:Holliday junction branch migration protein RuvA [Vagococcus coleopterorum]QIL45896.1 Holliday junction branch migration protein RuvA [Vagococcus coleopterorum]